MDEKYSRIQFPTAPLLTDEEVYELKKRIRAGDNSARNELVSRNLRLVMSVVNRFSREADDKEDLFQVGCIGLLKAVDRFDESYGNRFSTYAVPVILGTIREHLRSSSYLKIGRTLRDRALRVKEALDILRIETGREPSINEISDKTGLSGEEIIEAQGSLKSVVSLSEPLSADDSIHIKDKIASPSSTDDRLDSIALRQAMELLDSTERAVIEMRFFDDLKQVQVAEQLGISQPQVSKIEKYALKRLRSKLYVI